MQAGQAKDVFSIAANSNDFTISSFGSSAKIDFSKFGLTSKTEVTATANKTVVDKSLYMLKLNEEIANKDFSGNNFGELFANDPAAHKAFNSSNTSNVNAVIGVAGKDVVQFYKLTADGDGNVTANELSLLGSVTMEANATFNSGNVEIA